MLGAHKSRTWHRLMADARNFAKAMADRRNLKLPKAPNPFEVIRNCLMKFDALEKDLLRQNGDYLGLCSMLLNCKFKTHSIKD